MNFGIALDGLLVDEFDYIRRRDWKPDVKIKIQSPDKNSKMTAKYLYVESRFGKVPWIPNMIEMVTNDDWEGIIIDGDD